MCAEIGAPCCCVVEDLCDDATPAKVRRQVEAALGPIAILVNNAGVAPKVRGKGPGLLETDDTLWDRVLGINLRAMFRFCRTFVPGMQVGRWGRIVNVSSLGGRTKSLIAGPSYMASKAAILGLTRSVAAQFARDGITANCVAPGRIAGRLEVSTDPDINAQYRAGIPVGRFGESDEVAALVEFLARC